MLQEIILKLLAYYEPDRFKRSNGLIREPEFSAYTPRELTQAHQALRRAMLLEMRATGRSDASYKLTAAGIAARDALKEAQ